MLQNTAQPEYIETLVNVRYAETDQMGIVYYANYLVWFEVGRVAWCKAKGFRYADMESRDNRYLIVVEASCRYKSPHVGDDIIKNRWQKRPTGPFAILRRRRATTSLRRGNRPCCNGP
jgi:acyl-CoA thioester hydrolase